MSLDEFKRWKIYETQFGPLNLALRIERIVALAAAPHLKGNPVRKLMPWPKQLEQDQEQEGSGSIQEAFAIIQGAARAGNKRGKRGN